eukprot:490317-Prymnesium_polylepis.1
MPTHRRARSALSYTCTPPAGKAHSQNTRTQASHFAAESPRHCLTDDAYVFTTSQKMSGIEIRTVYIGGSISFASKTMGDATSPDASQLSVWITHKKHSAELMRNGGALKSI